jgi:hypothetical protein
MKHIERILSIHPFRLILKFTTGEVREVDLGPTLRAHGSRTDSAYGRLLDPEVFRHARLDSESRTVCWDGLAREIMPDGSEQPAPLDLCPDMLYGLSTPLATGATEPTKAQDYKPSETSGFVLKEEPPART